ncbi:hypothetical protein VKT23_015743 [Stygiomarasmius scandens]|uniref:N-acetyltransferase domain-containing protein n=1 Tax=Marasmiellus scandens TaxID=2682957 RepID=A0ABR1J0C9_9AGAR
MPAEPKPDSRIIISVCSPSQFPSEIPSLAKLLKETVDENICINFCLPFSLQDAENWWKKLEGDIETGKVILVLAHARYEAEAKEMTIDSELELEPDNARKNDRSHRLVGCVILYLEQRTNAPHLGEIGKFLVKKDERGSGIGRRLMECLENQARKHGRWMLFLGTQTGSAGERFYERNGWTRIGIFPDVMYLPDKSSMSELTFLYKRI